MGHQETYHRNEDYARFLAGWDPAFYAKYADVLCPGRAGGRVLDVGCGVGQVLGRLKKLGCAAYGVDVSEPNIERARRVSELAQVYDGKTLPFEPGYFDSAGAFNVLEHVDEPEAFILELVRVVKPDGRIVISSPNFFRVLGFRDYHPRMRGIRSKWENFRRIQAKRRQIKRAPELVKFDRMTPIVRPNFQPDDDAIIATNPFEMAHFLERAGCEVNSVSCTDRPVAKWVDWALNAGPWRYVMFNAFVTARKRAS